MSLHAFFDSVATALEPAGYSGVDYSTLPLHSLQWLLGLAAAYLLFVLWRSRANVSDPKPRDVRWAVVLWNVFMCAYSLYAFVGFAARLAATYLAQPGAVGWDYFVCDPAARITRGAEWWFYSFYLSKYLEYMDTVFLLLKGKVVLPPEALTYGLHVYHHTVTASIVYIVDTVHVNVGFMGPLTNTFVHVFMYAYYVLAELNLIDRRLGGKLITPIQLVQFMLCLCMGVYETLFPAACGAHMAAVVYLWANYIAFFVLFSLIFFEKKSARTVHKKLE